MNRTAHTPGPWTYDTNVFNRDRAFAINAHDDAEGEDGDAEQCVAEVCASGRPGEAEADARLIAAAPDLLAACELALRRIDPDSERERNGKRPKDASVLEGWAQEACNALRAAIAKAKGGAA